MKIKWLNPTEHQKYESSFKGGNTPLLILIGIVMCVICAALFMSKLLVHGEFNTLQFFMTLTILLWLYTPNIIVYIQQKK